MPKNLKKFSKSKSGSKSDRSSGSNSESDSESSISSNSAEFCSIEAKMVLNDKYILIKKLGKGAFSTVWLAYNYKTSEFNAVKVQNVEDFEDGIKEMDILTKVRNYNCKYINHMVDNFVHESDEGEYVCMVFELMAGSAFDLIKKGKYYDGIPMSSVKHILYQLLIGVEILHNKNKIVHSDIKPENILIVGVGKKISELIAKFNQLKFNDVLKKNKLIFKTHKNKNKTKDSAEIALESTINETFKILFSKTIISKNNNNKNTSKVKLESESDSSSESESDSDSDSDSDNGYESLSERRSAHTARISRELIESSDDSDLDDFDNSDNSDNSDLDESETESEKEDKNADSIIDDKFVCPNIIAKLSDFGTSFADDESKPKGDIQTRYYRSPEIIMRHEYSYSADIWSIACLAYELLTGEILFNPKPISTKNKDRQHLYDIQKRLGPIPESMINKSRKRDVFFNSAKLLKGVNKIHYKPLWVLFKNKIKNVSEIEITNFTDLVLKMLEYDPKKRITVEDCLNHNFFLDIKQSYIVDQEKEKEKEKTMAVTTANVINPEIKNTINKILTKQTGPNSIKKLKTMIQNRKK